MSLEKLRAKREQLEKESAKTFRNMDKIINESQRVAEVARNSEQILDDLDREFEEQTGLKGKDVAFLFVAVGLQIARWVIANQLTEVESAGHGNKKEDALHELQKKIMGIFGSGEYIEESEYYASMEHIITTLGVPYDATASLTEESIESLKNKGRFWDFDLEKLIPKEKLNLFKGGNHRFSTLGHDPILGLIFGTGNILTNTITCVKTPIALGGINIPVIITNHVVYTSDFKDPRIADYASTIVMLDTVVDRIIDQPEAFVAAFIKQVIHIGTDLYTPCGIQIPGANLILSNSNVETLAKYISTGDIIKVGISAKLAILINTIISTLHMMTYDEKTNISRDLYNVKTKKIIMYSNLIASASNVVWVGANLYCGRENAIKELDVGGLLVTIYRLITDREYISKIKEEFIYGRFKDMINGKDLELE